jgi:hypothetical protein
MDHHLEHLLSIGVLTGSRAFNCNHLDSDYDIVLTYSDMPEIPTWSIINDTDFTADDYIESPDGTTIGFDLSEHTEFEDEPFIDYDKHTIWGPLQRIVKYESPFFSNAIINLFVYNDKDKHVQKVQET